MKHKHLFQALCPCLPIRTQRFLEGTCVVVGPKSILSGEQIIFGETVNICFVTWPPLTGDVSLTSTRLGPFYIFHESKQDYQ